LESKEIRFRLSLEDAEILKELASEQKTSESELIRRYLRSLSSKFKGEVKPVGYPEGRLRSGDVVSKVQDLAKEIDSASKRETVTK